MDFLAAGSLAILSTDSMLVALNWLFIGKEDMCSGTTPVYRNVFFTGMSSSTGLLDAVDDIVMVLVRHLVIQRQDNGRVREHICDGERLLP